MLRLRLIIVLSEICTCLLSVQGIIIEGPRNVTYVPGRTPLPITLICNVTRFPFWRVNGTLYTVGDLLVGSVEGHDISGPNIVINIPMNDTEYICVSSALDADDVVSVPAFLYIAAAPNQIPNVVIMADTITLIGDIVTLTLSWGEPFNNLDPIVNYTVSCSGDVTCPPNFTTTDNTTRSYTITNLTPMTNYTFSVVATNSIGSGEAGVVMITAPSLPGNVTGVMLTCEVVKPINQCTVDRDPITVGNGPLEQPLVYEVYYNGTRENVTSPTTTLTFTAPSLPDGVFVDIITVIVTAINRSGHGLPSNPDYNKISTVPIANEMSTVTLNGLACGVTYTITAGGRLDGDFVGPRSSLDPSSEINLPCAIVPTTTSATMTPMTMTPYTTATPALRPPDTGETSDDDNTGAIVGGVVGGIVAAIIIIIIIIILVYVWCCMKKRKISSPVVAMSNIPVYDNVQDPAVCDKVKMETSQAYQEMPSDHNRKGPDPAYQELSHSGITNVSKPAGDVNYHEDIINKQNIKMTENPSYAVP